MYGVLGVNTYSDTGTELLINFPYMPETIGSWLKEMMARRGLSQARLARDLPAAPSVINRWVNDNASPDPINCAKLASFFNEPIEKVYALAGHPASYEPGPVRPLSIRERALEFLSGMPVAVPVVDQLASAGPGQQVMDYVYLEPGYETDGRYVAIRVQGKSMEPDYRSGDTIIIDTEDPGEPGETVVATVGDNIYVKDLKERGGKVQLVGRDGKTIPSEGARIEGVVIQVIRHVRRR